MSIGPFRDPSVELTILKNFGQTTTETFESSAQRNGAILSSKLNRPRPNDIPKSRASVHTKYILVLNLKLPRIPHVQPSSSTVRR